ncbi:hypothetical protein CGJ91_24050 [Vibrio parahaemolyticus]|nr:hypothetical protein [Vibrio parahaemolyticus]TOC10396.1 hypothetical protein CGJ91_24050 [Vibrio parahaemolyticus]
MKFGGSALLPLNAALCFSQLGESMEQYLKSKLLLEEVEVLLHNSPSLYADTPSCIVLSKHALTTLKNIFDFSKTLKPKYKDFPQLQIAIKHCYQELEFANYLRNNISGHLGQSALSDLLKWRPELVSDLKQFDSTKSFVHFHKMTMVYVFNSYRDKEGQHLYFKEETLTEVEYDFSKVRGFIIDTLEGVQFTLQLVCSSLKVDFDKKIETFDYDEKLICSAAHTIKKLKA